MGTATDLFWGFMYRSVLCKLYEINVLLYITIEKVSAGIPYQGHNFSRWVWITWKKFQGEHISSRKEDFQGKTKMKCICVKET